MAENLFEDLVPRDAPKPKKAASGLFDDLIPAPVQHAPGVTGQRGEGVSTEDEQEPNIGRKGDMRPDSRVKIGALSDKFTNIAALGFGDEIVSGMRAPVDAAINAITGRGPTDLGETYDQAKAEQDASFAALAEERPIANAVATVGGALFPAAGAIRLVKGGSGLLTAATGGSGLVGKTIRGAGTGGTIGAISGAGEGNSLRERLELAKEGAQTGAAIGAALPGGAKVIGQGIRLVKAVGRAATAPLRSLADKETFAAGKVAEALKRDKLSPERAENLLRLRGQVKPDTVLADVGGENTGNLLRAAANVPSEARGKLVRDLFVRQERQLDRIRADVGAAFGDPKTFNGTVENLTLARKQNAKPLFDAAFQTGTPWTVELQSVLSRPLTRKLVGRAEEAAANRGEQFKAIFAQVSPDGKTVKFARVPDTEALHRVKMEIDSAISQLKRREETGLGNVQLRDLTILKKDLLGAIKNPLYKRALNQYAGDSAAVNAIDDGFENGLSMEPDAIGETLRALSKSEADLWRLGLARKVVNQLRDTGRAGTNRAEILNSPKYLDRLRAAFKDSPTGKDFMRKLALERKMVQTREAVRGNSTSAKQLAEGMEAGVEAENVRDAIDMTTQLASGNYFGAALKWLNRAKNTATGLRPEVADQIIKMLTSKDPAMVARAQQLVQREIAKLTRRQGTAGRVEQGVNVSGFGAIPSLVSQDGQTATR
jgi:hypothetical protein